MASDEPSPVALQQVNEATLELLERRIESRVKASFFKSVGAPVGVAGVAAIVYTLFSWIPTHISSYLEKDPTFKSGLQKAAADYLTDPQRGRQFIQQTAREQMPPMVAEQVRAEVAAYFGGADGKRQVTGQVTESVGTFFRSEGQAAIKQQVTAYLAGNEVKQLIRDQVKVVLGPGVAGLLEPVMKNSMRQVSEALDLDEGLQVARGTGTAMLDKQTIEHLQDQLRGARGRALRQGQQPIAMTKTIRRGHAYDAGVIRDYVETLQREFGARFRHVVIMDAADGGFLARIEPGLFGQRLETARDRLMRVLNAEAREMSAAQVQAELNRLFGVATDVAIQPGVSMRDAMRDRLWQRAPAGEVAVLREGKRFMGTTTHDALLAAVLRPLG